MTIDDKIRGEKIQNDIKREAAKISARRKTDEYECFTGEEISPSNQSRIEEQANFTYSPIGKSLKNK